MKAFFCPEQGIVREAGFKGFKLEPETFNPEPFLLTGAFKIIYQKRLRHDHLGWVSPFSRCVTV